MQNFKLITLLVSLFIASITGVVAQEASKVKDLKEFSWMKGDWEGKSGTSSFFEGYEMKNHTLIIIKYYSDASLAKVEGGGMIYLQNGDIYHTSGRGKWKLAKRNKDSWFFTPVANASNESELVFMNPDSWYAEIISSGRVKK